MSPLRDPGGMLSVRSVAALRRIFTIRYFEILEWFPCRLE